MNYWIQSSNANLNHNHFSTWLQAKITVRPKHEKVRQPDETKKSSYIKLDNLDKAREIQSEYSLDT